MRVLGGFGVRFMGVELVFRRRWRIISERGKWGGKDGRRGVEDGRWYDRRMDGDV
jgi:hypothetical protein